MTDRRPLSDEELEALALAADPDEPLAADAMPIDVYLGAAPLPLPLWYMPPVARRRRLPRRWLLPVVLILVAAFLLIDALGLCNTYGVLSL